MLICLAFYNNLIYAFPLDHFVRNKLVLKCYKIKDCVEYQTITEHRVTGRDFIQKYQVQLFNNYEKLM